MNVTQRFRNGELIEYVVDGVSFPKSGQVTTHKVVRITKGPGTELKKLLSKLGFKPVPNCKCHQHIKEMNEKGILWCEQNTYTIVGWLKEEADRAKLPFVEFGARKIVRRAIHNASRII